MHKWKTVFLQRVHHNTDSQIHCQYPKICKRFLLTHVSNLITHLTTVTADSSWTVTERAPDLKKHSPLLSLCLQPLIPLLITMTAGFLIEPVQGLLLNMLSHRAAREQYESATAHSKHMGVSTDVRCCVKQGGRRVTAAREYNKGLTENGNRIWELIVKQMIKLSPGQWRVQVQINRLMFQVTKHQPGSWLMCYKELLLQIANWDN